LGMAKRTTLTLATKKSFEVPSFEGNRLILEHDNTSGPAYGIGIQALTVDLDPESYSETALGLGAAWGFGDRLVLGLGLRGLLVNSDIDDVSASGFNFGLGLIWAMSDKERLSVSTPHLLSRIYWKFDSTERLPQIASLGWMRMWSPNILTTAEVELREGEESPYKLAGGAEWWLVPDRIALRGGYRVLRGGISNISSPTFGAGLRFLALTFDYAYRVESDALNDTHRVGIVLDL
jgi:hypothetical protein